MEKLDYFFQNISNFCLSNILYALGILKSIKFYQNYLKTVEQIKNNNFIAVFKIRFNQFNFMLIASHYAFLHFFKHFLSSREHILHLNWILLNGFPSWFNLFPVVYCFLCNQVASLLYFKNHRVVFNVLKFIFLNSTISVPFTGISAAIAIVFNFRLSLVRPNFATYSVSQELVNAKLFGNKNYNQAQVLQRLQFFAIFSVNYLNVFMLIMCKCYKYFLFKIKVFICFLDIEVFSHVYFYWKDYTTFFTFERKNFQLIFHLFFGYFYLFYVFIFMIIFCNVLLQVAGQGIVLGVVGHFKIIQLTKFCVNLCSFSNRKFFTPRKFDTFFKKIDSFLVLLADANRVYGAAFFVYIVINMPLNALLIMMLNKTGQIVGRVLRIGSAVYVVVQLFLIFAVTCFFAKVSTKFHKTVKRVIRSSVEGLTVNEKSTTPFWPLKSRLKLARYIETFHTSKQFTLKYGQYGSVTFSSIGKVHDESLSFI